MSEEVKNLEKEALVGISSAQDLQGLEQQEIFYLGRKGKLNALFPKISTLQATERKEFGEAINFTKQAIESAVASRRQELQMKAFEKLGETEWIDITQPGTKPPEGHVHLVTHTIREVSEIFGRLGFTRVRHPEVDWDWYAFEALNMPADHPARDEWETFFMDTPVDPKKGKMVLTPHTSNGQIHEMEKGKLPIRMINISKCYRRQSDVSHAPMFHQFEGLLIDKNVAVTHLKGVLDYFAREFFGEQRKTRLRPFHFRFTEPSFEVDISCGVCNGTGFLSRSEVGDPPTTYNPQPATSAKCRLCKSGWLELGGAGMVHPNVIKACGIDPNEWNGFAFGWGVERTAMMKSGISIDDIRILYKNDLRFLKQF